MNTVLPLTSPPANICILRLSALGDVTHTLPVVRAIQRYWPHTRITWICGKLEHKLLAEIGGVRFIVFDKKAGWREYLRIRKLLRDEQFDVLLHMQVALRANLLSTMIRAPIRLGWDPARSRDFHQQFINAHIESASCQHQAQGFLAFARALGIDVDEPEWNFPITEAARTFATRYTAGNKKTLLISACSSHELRNWHVQGYARVADHAVQALGMQVILSGGPSELERNTAAAIERAARSDLVNLVGQDTLQESLGLLTAVDVVLSPDSGPAHIANALGTPVIGLYACTWSRRSGPYCYLDHCVDHFEQAAEQFLHKSAMALRWGTKIERPGVMDLIQVDEVIARLERLVGVESV